MPRPRLTYNTSVFVNCPFDAEYLPLFRAVVFTIEWCGYRTRCALEVDGLIEGQPNESEPPGPHFFSSTTILNARLAACTRPNPSPASSAPFGAGDTAVVSVATRSYSPGCVQ